MSARSVSSRSICWYSGLLPSKSLPVVRREGVLEPDHHGGQEGVTP
jgi:hypothetical protein